ncbi:hypothetical protein ABZ734_28020 [Streptomyces sp. NPDC006660]|uniref:hypothetical protein n=1 Tax=Streptomyces sp. NPDC006660 TaxID=3156901 RepID=UPI0033E9C30D
MGVDEGGETGEDDEDGTGAVGSLLHHVVPPTGSEGQAGSTMQEVERAREQVESV